MTDTSSFFTADASRDVPRDQWGRYKLPDADGNTSGWTRATTFAEALTEQFGLSIYKQRQVALGLGRRPDLVALASTIVGPEDKRALGDIVDSAHMAAATDAKANHGTAVHAACALAERSADLLGAVPAELRTDVGGYLSAVNAAGLRILPQYIERTLIVPQYHVAGTADNFVLCPDGKVRVLDKKTGNLDYAAIEFAVQLALYANASALRNYTTGQYEEMPANLATDYAIIAHIALGTGITTLYRVNIQQGWAWARLCAEVRDARQTKHVLTPYVVEDGLAAPAHRIVNPVAAQTPTGPEVRVVPVQLPPSPIQQATTTAVDSFWDQDFGTDEDELTGFAPAPVSPPFTPAASAAEPVTASAPPSAEAGQSPFPIAPGAPATVPDTARAVVAADPMPPTASAAGATDADHGAQPVPLLTDDEWEARGKELATAYKTKARLQTLAREVMVQASEKSGTQITESSPDGIKLSQYQWKIAVGILKLATKWDIPVAAPEGKPRAKAEAPQRPEPDMRLKMIRTMPTQQGLIEFKANVGEAWTPELEQASKTRYEELEVAKNSAPNAPDGSRVLTPMETIVGATSVQTVQLAWRMATDDGVHQDRWTPELKAAADTKMSDLASTP